MNQQLVFHTLFLVSFGTCSMVDISENRLNEELRETEWDEPRGTEADDPWETEWDVTFDNLAEIHNKLCLHHYTCPQYRDTVASSCCGSCTCDNLCVHQGSCCLSAYHNLTHANQSSRNSRHSCDNLQYITSENTDFSTSQAFLTVAQCDVDYQNEATVDRCENQRQDLDTLLPVTEPLSSIHFRNKYCALCNNVDENATLIEWKLHINSHKHIPLSTTNLLETIRRTRGNIYFVPPVYIDEPYCLPFAPYTITTCNETGLWRNYDIETELACESFIDPFNLTYKNYFCYVCNVEEVEPWDSWTCPPLGGFNSETPKFSAIIDAAFAKHGGLASDALNCESTQFQDEKLMACRDVLCHPGRILKTGKCLNDPQYSDQSTCTSIDIRLIPLHSLTHRERVEVISFMREDFQSKFPALHGRIRDFLLVSQTNEIDNIVFIIIRIVAQFETLDIMYEFFDAIVYMEEILIRPAHDIYSRFSLELEALDIPFFEHGGIFEDKPSGPFERLRGQDPNDYSLCHSNTTIQINKITLCPFMKLRLDEMPMSFNVDDLVMKDIAGTTLKHFTRWEHKIENDYVLICLDDYFQIYHLITPTKTESVRSSAKRIRSLFNMFLPWFLMFV